jgi:hypothetical protein
MTGGRGAGGACASETGGVAEVAAPVPEGEAMEDSIPIPATAQATTARRFARILPDPAREHRADRDRPVTRLCARFSRSLCVITSANYTSHRPPGPRVGPGRERHSFPGTARASAAEVDVRRAGLQAPGESVGNFVERSPVRGQLLEGGQFRESHYHSHMNREFSWLRQPV